MSLKFALWGALALVLFAAEAMAPGAFMLWFGFAAAAMALVVLALPGLGWLVQAVLFSLFSLVSVGVYLKWFRGKGRGSDRPLLNQRANSLVGQVVKLEQGIERGRGRVQIADAFWTVEGPDLPAGTAVRIVATDGMTLKVQEA
ncbi:NfeD family protein [Pseudoxanthomonas helianthi]|uniref:NfeD family protein n=1 Tax=Pseudoxanthomonas helianthi TaxID=1453541 RepID=A0A941AUF0_9GAMM|nr:NfeD family protein [Pseudoxanthomonas helianthi]MBP3983088.1 NfeD family protein [Pseudoxanthomonas helianthi]